MRARHFNIWWSTCTKWVCVAHRNALKAPFVWLGIAKRSGGEAARLASELHRPSTGVPELQEQDPAGDAAEETIVRPLPRWKVLAAIAC